MRVHGPVHLELRELPSAFARLQQALEGSPDAGVAEALAALREVTGGYDTGRALCRTHWRLLEALHALELDLHEHIR
jgi:hypothetical protein